MVISDSCKFVSSVGKSSPEMKNWLISSARTYDAVNSHYALVHWR